MTLSIDLELPSVEQVLDALKYADSDYEWKLDDRTAVVNVFPREKAFLDWSIGQST